MHHWLRRFKIKKSTRVTVTVLEHKMILKILNGLLAACQNDCSIFGAKSLTIVKNHEQITHDKDALTTEVFQSAQSPKTKNLLIK